MLSAGFMKPVVHDLELRSEMTNTCALLPPKQASSQQIDSATHDEESACVETHADTGQQFTFLTVAGLSNFCASVQEAARMRSTIDIQQVQKQAASVKQQNEHFSLAREIAALKMQLAQAQLQQPLKGPVEPLMSGVV